MSEITQQGEGQRALPRPVIILLGTAALVIALAGLQAVHSIVAPTFLAATLVITMNPIRTWMVRHRIPGWIAATVVLILLWIVLLGLIAMVAYAGAKLATIIPAYSDEFNSWYTSASNYLADLGIGNDQINTALEQVNYGSVFSFAQGILGQTVNAGSTFVFLLTVSVFVVMDANDVPLRLIAIAKVKPHLASALQGFAHSIRTYWLVTTAFGLIVALLDGIALYLLDVPLPVTWAMLSFITNYIPNVGFVIGLLPPALLGTLDGGVSTGIAVVAVYAVLNFVVQTIVQPRITGDAVGLSTSVAFLSLALWTFVLGPLGALMAIPVTLFVKTILIDADPNSRWANAFLSNRTDDPEKAAVTN